MELKRVIQIPIKVSKQARGVSLEDVVSLENEFPIGDCPYSTSSNFLKISFSSMLEIIPLLQKQCTEVI